MPLVDVTYGSGVSEHLIETLASALPDIVADGVACAEEPWSGPPQLGDLEIRFRARHAHDVGELACLVEVRTKLLPSRVEDKQDRAERMLSAISTAVPALGPVGVWLILSEGAWAQSCDF